MKTIVLSKSILFLLFLQFLLTSQFTFSQKNTNAITKENSLLGTSEWQLTHPATHREIEGYASKTSVATGDSIQLFVNTKALKYSITVYRMGWYNGLGGRLISGPFLADGSVQEIPKPATKTGMVECNWTHPFTLKIEDHWTTGVYLAKLQEHASNRQSYIIFVVRNDTKAADILFQLPVTTYQAYNVWGGKSLYSHESGDALPWGSSKGHAAVKVSFNRPYAASTNLKAANGMGAGEFLTNVQSSNEGYPLNCSGWDYPMVRWLEKNGYDINYCTNIDIHTSLDILKRNTLFLSQGHDEYWSKEMKDHVIAARNSGINLAFFSANTAYWQIRFEPSIYTNEANRTIVCYKNAKKDPVDDITTTVLFRDPPVSSPESAFIGGQYFEDRVNSDIVISDASHSIFKDTKLKNGDRLKGLLGYEVNKKTDHSPTNTQVLTSSKAFYQYSDDLGVTAKIKSFMIRLNFLVAILACLFILVCIFYILKYLKKRSTVFQKFNKAITTVSGVILIFSLVALYIFQAKYKSNMTIYTAKSGAKVFSTGTIQWSWGLDDYNVPELRASSYDKNVEIITHNVLQLLGVTNSPSKETKSK